MATKKPQPAYLSASAQDLNWDAAEAYLNQPKAEQPAPSAGVLRTAGDMGIKAAQGIVGIGESAVGIGSLATGGLAGQGMRAIGYDPKATKEMLGEYLSDSQKASDAEVAKAEGFVDTVIAALKNPRAIAGSVAESAPGTLMGMGISLAAARAIGTKAAIAAAAEHGGLGTAAGKVAGAEATKAALEQATGKLMWVGSGVEGAQAAGQIADQAQADGRDYSQYAAPAILAGMGTAAIGRGAGKLMGDAETGIVAQAAGGAGAGGIKGSFPARVAKSILSEGALEEAPQSAQEQVWTNIATGKPWDDGVGNAAGMGFITGAAMGAGAAAVQRKTPEQRAADDTRAQKVPDVGPLSRAANAGLEQKALQLENNPDPLVAFPDGTVGKQSEVEAYINGLPESERIAARAQLLGIGAQQADVPAPELKAPLSLPGPDSAMPGGSVVVDTAGNARQETYGDRQAANATAAEREIIGQGVPRGGSSEAPQQGPFPALPGPMTELPGGNLIADATGIRPETYGDRQAATAAASRRQELGTPVPRGAGVQDATTYLNPQGKPFVTEFSAKRKLRELKLADTHEVTPSPEGGFVLQPVKENANAQVQPDNIGPAGDQAAAQVQPADANGGQAIEKYEVSAERMADTGKSDAGAGIGAASAGSSTNRKPALNLGAEVERYAGKYGKGMSAFNARIEANKRNRERPDLAWRAEDAESKFGPDRFEIVGYEKLAADSVSAKNAIKMSRVEDGDKLFVESPSGGIDFGEIAPDMANVMKRQSGKIRLEHGNAQFGLKHIEMRHGKQIKSMGFTSIPEFVSDAVKHIDSIWKPSKTSQLVVIQTTEKGKAVFVELRPSASGDFYTVKTAFPVGDDFAKRKEGWRLLWGGESVPTVASGAHPFAVSPPNAGAATTMTSGQSSDASVASNESVDKPQSGQGEQDANADSAKLLDDMALSSKDPGDSSQFAVSPQEAGEEVTIRSGQSPQSSREVAPADAFGASGFVDQSPNAGETPHMVRQNSGSDNITPAEPADKKPQKPETKYFKPDQKLIEKAVNDGIMPAGDIVATTPFKTKTAADRYIKKNGIADVVSKRDDVGYVFDVKLGTMTDAEKKQAAADVAALNKALRAAGEAPVEPLFEAPTANHALAQKIAKVFGTEVRFVSDNPEFEGAAHNGIAFLKAGMQRPELAIAGHEVFHTLEQSNPDLAEKLLTHVRGYLREDAVADRQVREDLVAGKSVPDAQVTSELLADINGSMWLDPKFWREMIQRDQNLFRQVAYRFMEAATKAVKSLTGTRFDVKALVTDVDAVRSLIAQTWADRNKARDAGSENENSKSSRTESDISFSRSKIIGNNERIRTPEQLRAFKNVGRTIEVPSLKERMAALWQDAGKKLAQGLADQFAPIKELSGEAYALMRLSKGAGGAFETMLRGGQLKLEDGVYNFDDAKRGGVIDRLLTPLQGEMDDFLWWVSANRADKLSKEDREHLFSADDIAALKSLNNGDTKFDYKLQHGANAGQVTRDRALIYRDALATFNEFHKNALDMAEQSGLIDPEARKLWESEFYVPFYRVDEDSGVRGANIKSGVVRQQAFKTLKGGSGKLNSDLLDNTLQNWAHLLDSAAKNRAAKASLNAAVNMGVAVESTEEATRQMAKSIGRRNNVVWYMDGGKQRYFLVDDPYIMTALQGLEYAGMKGPLMDALGTMKHVLTIGVTASPFFKVRNLIRDSVSAIGVAPLDYNVASNLKQGWKLTNPKSDAYFKLLAGGGTIHFGTMLEGSESKRVRALVEAGVDAGTILDNESKYKAFYKRVIEPAIDAYQELGNRGEAINRAALYDQLIKQGKSHAEASLMARDLMDFSMGGAWAGIRFLTQVVPFMNARIQGLYKLGKSAKEDPARFATVLGAVAMSSIALMLAYSDDEDWKKREDWDRDSYWWFKIGGTAFRIPKPFEIGAIGTLAERGIEYFTSDEMTGERFRKRLYALLSDNLAMNPTPQLVKPILDIYANKDSFSGRPIESMGMDKLQPEYRFTARTSMAARGISTAGNAITGAIGVDFASPVQVDHMIKGYFGWLGSFIVGTGDLIARPATGQPGGATPDYWKTATGGMISDVNSASSRYVSQMYDQAKVLEEAYGTHRMLIKQGKADEAREFAADNADSLRKYKSVESVKRVEARLNERIRMIERSAKSGTEKRELIQQIQRQKDRVARQISS